MSHTLLLLFKWNTSLCLGLSLVMFSTEELWSITNGWVVLLVNQIICGRSSVWLTGSDKSLSVNLSVLWTTIWRFFSHQGGEPTFFSLVSDVFLFQVIQLWQTTCRQMVSFTTQFDHTRTGLKPVHLKRLTPLWPVLHPPLPSINQRKCKLNKGWS